VKEPNIITTGFSASKRDSRYSLPPVSFNVKLMAFCPVFSPTALKPCVPAGLTGQLAVRLVGNSGSETEVAGAGSDEASGRTDDGGALIVSAEDVATGEPQPGNVKTNTQTVASRAISFFITVSALS